MATLLSCQPPPPAGWVTVGERDCQFVARPVAEASTGAQIQDLLVYPDTEGTPHTTADGSSLFLPVQENRLKKAMHTWRDHGLVQALEEFSSSEEDSEITLPMMVASGILSGIRQFQTLHGSLSPQSQMSISNLCQEYSTLSDWESFPIRAMALHPRLHYIAVGRQDDAIEIRHLSHPDHRVILKDKKQVALACIQWAPHCSTLLAAGTATGVLLWNVDPAVHTTSEWVRSGLLQSVCQMSAHCGNSEGSSTMAALLCYCGDAAEFLTSWVRVETSPGHTPISTLSWSPRGNFLVSASPADCNLIVWDIPMGVATPVKRWKGGGLTQVSWSPDGQRVVASSISAVFRVWETQTWTCETWTHVSGRCKACCWSPQGDILLFALEGDPLLYYLSFHGKEYPAGSATAVSCADLTPCNIVTGGQEMELGGIVRTMAWDPTGQRLAIVFTVDSPSADLVLILRTRTSHLLEILPGGFIRGQEGELPEIVAFQEHRAEGALLAIAWSSGRISFSPLHFTHSDLTHPEQLASLSHPSGAPPPATPLPLYSTQGSSTWEQ